jgi:hypothetical protein
MNMASKLGEDLAECGEILLTEAARRGLRGNEADVAERTYDISGLTISAYRVG